MSLDHAHSSLSGLPDLLLHSRAGLLQEFLFNQPVSLIWIVKIEAMLCPHLYQCLHLALDRREQLLGFDALIFEPDKLIGDFGSLGAVQAVIVFQMLNLM
jgi:hypothetical protein